MKVTVKHAIYDHILQGDQIDAGCLVDKLAYIRDLCGGMVWGEIETTDQELPKYAQYVDTYYGINVYYDRITDSYLFEDFN